MLNRAEKNKNNKDQGKTQHKTPRNKNNKATQNKDNTRTTVLERPAA